MSVGYVVLFNVFNTRQLINNKLQTPNIIKTLPNKSMSRPWGFCEEPKFGYSLLLWGSKPRCTLYAVWWWWWWCFYLLSSLQSYRAAQHQSHRLCQSCHPQSAPVWQLIGAAGCRSCRDWSVCSLISCNPLVIPQGSNISISPATACNISITWQTTSTKLAILVLGIRAENTLLFSSDDAQQHNSGEGDAAVILILTDWRLLVTRRLSGCLGPR